MPRTFQPGATTRFAARPATETGAHVHASLYERAGAELRFNTAICVAPSGEVVARTRKQHIPVTAGYYEDRHFRPGDSGYPVVEIAGAGFGFPTCWDQWFPECSSRSGCHRSWTSPILNGSRSRGFTPAGESGGCSAVISAGRSTRTSL